MNNSDWIRVSRSEPCPICERVDWCLIAADKSAAICQRVESEKRCGDAGHLHRLRDDYIPPRRRTVRRKTPKARPDCLAIHKRCVDAMRPESLGWLSNDLGISVEAFKRFGFGYCDEKNAYAYPMLRPGGSSCGIKYRTRAGKKFCETGSVSGIYFDIDSLSSDSLVIVEGATDAMAMFDLGFVSVIGRDNCTGNTLQIVTLCRRLKPKCIVIIPDNDKHGAGLRGAESLQQILSIKHHVELVELPEGINDVRDCIQHEGSRDDLYGTITARIAQLNIQIGRKKASSER